MKIAITGATGFVGQRLVERASAAGHELWVLTRRSEVAQRLFPPATFPQLTVVAYTPTEPGPWQQTLSGCDAVVNLAGAAIADERWTPARKQVILDSRQLTTRNLVAAIAQANPKPQVLVSASAIGYYGTSETARFDETSPPAKDFLAQVCQAWEAEAKAVEASGVRLVILRNGIILGMGGAIAKMLPPFKLFLGGPIGSGRQWFSWIHRDDGVNLILKAITDTRMVGVYNATAPNPVRMAEFCQVLGDVLHRPSWLPVPDVVLHTILGDAAQVVLEGQQVIPDRTIASGFTYQYPQVREALVEILAK
ncbi:thylakoid membrane protein ThyD [Trichothermofontia sp.]